MTDRHVDIILGAISSSMRGQNGYSDIVALVVQDVAGGELLRVGLASGHYCNRLPSGAIEDLCSVAKDGETLAVVNRGILLRDDPDLRDRYQLLKARAYRAYQP